jgi:hypothetical protein
VDQQSQSSTTTGEREQCRLPQFPRTAELRDIGLSDQMEALVADANEIKEATCEES